MKWSSGSSGSSGNALQPSPSFNRLSPYFKKLASQSWQATEDGLLAFSPLAHATCALSEDVVTQQNMEEGFALSDGRT